ncbi:MAG: FtsX-like permease family protein [Bacteroidales bacterium]|nr:FtsX-like permease family protein [Bacteroidales bacterium]
MKKFFLWTWWLAFKFWKARKAHSIIQIVQSISFWGIAISSAALIIILSAFNGLENLITTSIKQFHASLRIEPKEGKYFTLSEIDTSLFTSSYCSSWSPVYEDMAIAQYGEYQKVVVIKGVRPNQGYEENFKDLLLDGLPILQGDSLNFCWVGLDLFYQLNISLTHYSNSLTLFAPHPKTSPSSLFTTDFKSLRILPVAVFSAQQTYDRLYIIAPYSFTIQLFERPSTCTAIEIFISPDVTETKAKKFFQSKLGDRWIVKTRFEQEEAIFKIIQTEKIFVSLLLSFIVLITSFTLITAITLTILTKMKDISILWAMGATIQKIRQLFFLEGLIITIFGLSVGLITGSIILMLQQQYGFVTFSTTSDTFASNVYPVKIYLHDYFYISGIVMFIGFILSYLASKQINVKDFQLRTPAS